MDLFSIFLPNIAYADFDSFLANVNSTIINPLIKLIFALGVAYFLYGVFVFFTNMDNESEKTAGKSHMLYGIIGLTVMMGVWGILNLVINTLDIKGINPEAGTVNLDNASSAPSSNTTGTSGSTTGTGLNPVINDNLDPVDDELNPDSPSGFESINDNLDPGSVDTSSTTNTSQTQTFTNDAELE